MKINSKFIKKAGIYCIKNIVNNKSYVGSSVNIHQRLQIHRAALRKNKHNNSYLQRSWNKHGEINFVCFVIEFCPEDSLLVREKYFIEIMGDFNITKEVIRNTPSEESKKKHSKTKKEMHSKNLLPRTVKPITQYSLEGDKIKDWPSITAASKELDIHPTTIIRNLQKTFSQGKGFLWTYLGSPTPMTFIKSRKVYDTNSRSSTIVFTSKEEVLKFDSWKLATIYFGKSASNIRQYYAKNMLFMKKYKIDLIKSDKLLENPNEGNQQPI